MWVSDSLMHLYPHAASKTFIANLRSEIQRLKVENNHVADLEARIVQLERDNATLQSQNLELEERSCATVGSCSLILTV